MQKKKRRRQLTNGDITFRSITYIVVAGLTTIIAFLLMKSAFTGLTKEITDWALVSVTAAYVVVASLQLWAMRRTLQAVIQQARISRDTERRQLRAYVVVKEATVTPGMGGIYGEKIVSVTARVTLLNVGQTPAYELRHRRSITIGEHVLRPVFPQAARFRRTMAVLGPGVTHPDDLGIGTAVTESQLAALQRGSTVIYFWGEVSYEDIFKKRRRTRFSVMYPRIITKLHDTSTSACPDGNDMT